jgi:hypothetical protein
MQPRQTRANRLRKQLKKSLPANRRRSERRLRLESLEDRRLLAGPELFAIRPDQGALLQEGDTLHIAPREFNLLFKGGANIDPATIAGNVRLVRANEPDGSAVFGNGNDVIVDAGFLGFADPTNRNQIVLRPASSAQHNSVSSTTMFPNDVYRIEVLGTLMSAAIPGPPPTPAYPFNNGNDYHLEFNLDLGTQVVAVVPQPISRTGTVLSQNRREIGVHFDDQDLNAGQADDPTFYRLVNMALTSNETGGTRDRMILPASVAYNASADTATLTFASDIPEGTYRLEIGHSDEPNNTLTAAIGVGTLFSNSPLSYLGYLGDDTGTSTNTADVDTYKVNLRAGTNLTVTSAPREASLDTRLRLLNSAGTEIVAVNNGAAGAMDTLNSAVALAGDYYVEVSGTAGFGSYQLNISSTTATPGSDVNSSFSQAAANANVGILGATKLTIPGTIAPQTLMLPQYPGSLDEPGHRVIQAEAHVDGDFGILPVVPAWIPESTYSFPATIGTNPQGQPYLNLITPKEKQLVREIFDVYAIYAGIVFREVDSGGFWIAKGDLRALDPAAINGPGGVGGLGGGGGVVLDALEGWTSDVWNGDFFHTMFHEIGHAIGLGHAYDVPAVMSGSMVNSVYPGDADIVHLQRVHRPDATDIDLYQFTLETSGRFNAEIVAERRSLASQQLNSVLTLFNSAGDVIARNDDYYGNDSFLDLQLDAGTYYVGVTSTGNADYDPSIPDTGFGGTTDGDYQLVLSFATEVGGAALTDSAGTAIDGDADGRAGGTYQFWFESSDRTIFVDKLRDTTVNVVEGTGTVGDPFDTISAALAHAANRMIVPETASDAFRDGDTITISDGINSPFTFTFDYAAKLAAPLAIGSNTLTVDDRAPFPAFPPNFVIHVGSEAFTVTNVTGNQFTLSSNATAAHPAGENVGNGPSQPARSIPFHKNDTPTDLALAIRNEVNAQIGAIAQVSGREVNLTPLAGMTLTLDVSGTPALLLTPNLVRIVGNGGLDGDLSTLNDNRPYLIGLNNSSLALADGSDFQVPQGTTVMIDGGALFKMRKANLDSGSTSATIDRSGGAIQVLGTPVNSVFLRSLRDNSVGGNSAGVGPTAAAGDFGGIVFRDDSDMEDQLAYLNFVGHANITHGGGKVFVDSLESVYNPVHIDESRPTVQFNVIQGNSDAAISASPNSFDDSDGRLGPDVHGNFLVNNTVNGLFVRIETSLGALIDRLDVNGRWNDTDVTHVLTESLEISGNPGGQLTTGGVTSARSAGRLLVDPGVVVKLGDARIETVRGQSNFIAEGTADRPIVFTSIRDDRFGGSGTFDTSGNGTSSGVAGDWAGILLNHASHASIDHARIAYAGGDAPIEGVADDFDAIEVHQAELRLANSVVENNASGGSATSRLGRGSVPQATIYVRGAQPIIVNNVFQNNAGEVLTINANALRSDVNPDLGRSTGFLDAFDTFADNHGPLVRLNRLSNNAINGMEVRGETLTTETIWDDTDITHVLRGTVTVGNHHTYSGVRLQSSNTESLIVKLSGGSAGFTATGNGLEIEDRIGGTVQIMGSVGHPVLLTSLADDTVGAGFQPNGGAMLDTNNNGTTTSPAAGNWRGILLDRFSNDRNVEVVRETENVLTNATDVNWLPTAAQFLGVLASDKRDYTDAQEVRNQKGGDENSRLGFEVHGFISPDDPTDVDVYSFSGTAGTRVWFDLDRTDPALDPILELVNVSGTLLARSTDMPEAVSGSGPTGSANPQPLKVEPLLGDDYYSLNRLDAGMALVLPGTAGTQGTYFVRVRSTPPSGNINTLKGANAGQTTGNYQLQIRLQQTDEKPGSTVRYADIRYADVAIDVRGLPAHSPLLGESAESGANNDFFGTSQQLGNLLATDIAALNVAGIVNVASSGADVDWYTFDLNHINIQSLAGVNALGKTVSLVFDLDYADGAVRPDATIAVFDSAGSLIFVGRESNVANDQPLPGEGSDTDDLSRSSFGTRDGFIGPVHIPVGTPAGGKEQYYVAISSDRMQPTVLNAYINPDVVGWAGDLIRLEPVNSVKRVVEDHMGFQGYRSQGSQVNPTNSTSMIDLTQTNAANAKTVLDTHVIPFQLKDVALYVITDAAGSTGDVLYTANPFSGGPLVTRVTPAGGEVSSGNSDVQDIVMRSDGVLYGYARADNDAAVVGQRVTVNMETGQATGAANDNIPDRSPTPNVSNTNPNNPQFRDVATTDDVDALTYKRLGRSGSLGSAPNYDLFYAVRETDRGSAGLRNSKLYRANADSGSAARAAKSGVDNYYGERGDIQPTGVSFAGVSVTFSDTGTPPVTGTVRVESKIPGTAGNFTLTIQRSDNSNAIIGIPTANSLTVRLDTNPNAAPQDLIDLINNDATARQFFVAALTAGSISVGASGGPSDGQTLNGTGNNGSTNLTNGLVGLPLNGRVTGLAFDQFTNGTLYGVTTEGELIQINDTTGAVTRRLDYKGLLGGSPWDFQGLALGPQNIDAGNDGVGDYSRTLFAITSNGTLYAIDSQLAATVDASNASQVASTLRAVFADGPDPGTALDSSKQITGLTNAVGLAFSPLDFNLWHPTLKRGTDTGHGINTAPDNSRNPSNETRTIPDPGRGTSAIRDMNEGVGGASFYFGLEQVQTTINSSTQAYVQYKSGTNAQLGIMDQEVQSDLSSNAAIRNTYNLPAGALGRLQTNSFSLAGYVREDKPTLYFNYFLQTENYGAETGGSTIGSDGNNPFRDSARVFISADNGATWELLATNNSQLSAGDINNNNGQAELPSFLSHNSDAALNSDGARVRKWQQVQELFDNTGQWRQARVDLSDYRGQSNLRLRFDFSTAGSMNDATLTIGGTRSIDGQADPAHPTNSSAEFGEYLSTERSIRSTNNQFEGFYIDDIIVGFAERGEMVTASLQDPNFTDRQAFQGTGGRRSGSRENDSLVLPETYTGEYQFEVRRAGEYAGLNDDGTINVGTTFDTNDRHIAAPMTLVTSYDFEAGIPGAFSTPPTRSVTVAGTTINWTPPLFEAPWTFSTAQPYRGSGAARGGTDTASGLELIRTYSQAGAVRFAYKVVDNSPTGSENDGLIFFIDGMPQVVRWSSGDSSRPINPYVASGDVDYVVATFGVSSGQHVFTWAAANSDGTNPQVYIDDVLIYEGGTGLQGDQNKTRAQGQLIIDSNFITNTLGDAVNVQAGAADASGNVPHPGSLINFHPRNLTQWAPGVVIQNNVIAWAGLGSGGGSGIRFFGDTSGSPSPPIPFGRLVNNTFYGGNRVGTGITIDASTSPTVMNNVFVGLDIGISGGTASGAVVRSNFFQNNNNNGTTGTEVLSGGNSGTPFKNPTARNFYLTSGSLAIDSSLNTLQDRSNFLSLKDVLGIPASHIVAPDRDVYGQLRVDDVNEDPLGGGSAIFKDRGAVDRSDVEQPYAQLILPLDNELGADLDPNATVVYRQNLFLDRFSVLLSDGSGPNSPFEGTGVDPTTVNGSTVKLSRNGVVLTEGVDFVLGYSAANNMLLLTPLSSLWQPNSVYVIDFDNKVEALDPEAIFDLSGNLLRSNQPDGRTTFTIILGEFGFDFGDAPDASYGTLLASDGARHVILPDAPLRMGGFVDADEDGQPIVRADGNVHGDGDDSDVYFDKASSAFDVSPWRTPFTFQLPVFGGATAGLDGQSLVIDNTNNIQPPVTFTFDLAGGSNLAPPVVSIDYQSLDSQLILTQRLVNAINSHPSLAGITARHVGGGIVSLTGNYPSLNLSGASSVVATRRPPSEIVVHSAGPLVADGQTFVVSDGHSAPLTFEFEDAESANGLSSTTHVRVDFDSIPYTAADIAASMVQAINDQVASGRLTGWSASSLGDTVQLDTSAGYDDEDGVTFSKLFLPDVATTNTWMFNVAANAGGMLDAWIDLNRNGTFEPAEKLWLNGTNSNSVPVVAGTNSFGFDIRSMAQAVAVRGGPAFARFRVSATGGLFPTGLGIGGEVEDYEVRLLDNAQPTVANGLGALVDSGDLLNGKKTLDTNDDGILDVPDNIVNGRLDLDEDALYNASAADLSIDLWNVNGKAVFADVDIANGNGDALTFAVSVDQPSIVAASFNQDDRALLELDFPKDANGQAVVTVTATDQAGWSVSSSLTITINPVNDIPVFTKGPDVGLSPNLVLEDSGLNTIPGWATNISKGAANESSQTLAFVVTSNTNPTLFAAAPAITPTGTLTFTPAANQNGSATIKVKLTDDGGTAKGGKDETAEQTFTITVTAVNDPPTFTLRRSTVTVNEGSGLFSEAAFAYNLSPGPADESGQTFTGFTVSNNSTGLFVTQPAIDASGQLTFEPTESAQGDVIVTVTLTDNGGTANGGQPTSAQQTFTITITPVNDPPSFTLPSPASDTVLEDSGARSVAFATNISAGLGEDSQSPPQVLTFIIVNISNTALFTATGQPALSSAGTLTYTPATDANGTAVVQVKLRDDGGTPADLTDDLESGVQNFTINVTAVNDAPSFIPGANVTVNEDAGAQSLPWATSIQRGPATATDEIGQGLTFTITGNSNPALFAAPPAISGTPDAPPLGTLTFTPAADAFGSATIKVQLKDTGGTSPGIDTSIERTFTITVNSINDAPSFSVLPSHTVLEDAGSQSVSNFVTLIAPGPANESAQIVNFEIVSVSNPALFSTPPALVRNGTNATLTYTPAPNANGTAAVVVQLKDDGGNVGPGARDTSDPQTFTLNVTPVNDAPTFTRGLNPVVLEDAAIAPNVTVIADWATNVSTGPANEAPPVQFVDQFILTVPNAEQQALFDYGPEIVFNPATSKWDMRFRTSPNAVGFAMVEVRLKDTGATGTPNGDENTSLTQTTVITVNPVNDPPTFTMAAQHTVLEDAGPQIIPNWVTNIAPGPVNEVGQNVTFLISNIVNPGLFTVAGLPVIDVNGTLTYTPAPQANGNAVVYIRARDDGGTANGGIDTSPEQPFTISVTPVNDAPSFVPGPSQIVLEDAPLQNVAGWATNISKGPANESSQSLVFLVTNNNSGLFETQPAVAANGTLSYKPKANANGSAAVVVQLDDQGGSDNGGANLSAPFTVTITVTAVNDIPTFAPGADQVLNEDAGLRTISGWAGAISSGPADEVDQILTFQTNVVETTGNLQFSGAPTVDVATGNLSFTSAPHTNGTAKVTVQLFDSGGTANGGVDRSLVHTLTITVNAVNDAPSFTAGANQVVLEDAGAVSVANWATAIAPGPPAATDEANQVLTFIVTNSRNSLFTTTGQPALSSNGTLTYTPAPNQNGVATVVATLSDGIDVSPSRTFTITVTPVNDAPLFTSGPDQNVVEDAGPMLVAGWATGMQPGPATAVDETGQSLTFTVAVDSLSPSLTFSSLPTVDAGTGNLIYRAAPNAYGVGTFAVTLADNGGVLNGGVDRLTRMLTITVAAVNDAPVLLLPSGPLNYVEDQPLSPLDGLATVTDVDSADFSTGSLTVSLQNGTAGDQLNLIAAGGITRQGNTVLFNGQAIGTVAGGNAGAALVVDLASASATPAAVQALARAVAYANDIGDSTVSRIATMTLIDGDGGQDQAVASVTVNFTAVNDVPVAQFVSIDAQEDGPPVSGSFVADDVDPDDSPGSLVYVVYAPVLTNNGNGTFTFAPGTGFQDLGAGETRLVTFQYTATDSHGAVSDPATGRIWVHGVNDTPIANADQYSVRRDGTLAVPAPGVVQNDGDLDGDAQTVRLISGPSHGVLTLRPDGSFTYVPALNFTGNDSFTYRTNDGVADSNVATVTIVTSYPPIAVDDVLTTVQDRETIIPILNNDSDPNGSGPSDDGSLNFGSVVIVVPPRNGSVVVNGNGTVTYTPDPGYLGADDFSYVVSDNDGVQSDPAQVVLQVNTPHPWQNPDINYDVDDSGAVTPLDVLLLINQINRQGSYQLPNPPSSDDTPPPYYDVNGDEWLSPQDVLTVINYLNSQTSGAGEGEGELAGGAAGTSVFLVGSGTLQATDAMLDVAGESGSALQRDGDGSGLTQSDEDRVLVERPAERASWSAGLSADGTRTDEGYSSEHDDLLDDLAWDVLQSSDAQNERDALFGRGLI